MVGRVLQKAVGKDGFDKSRKMTVGFARYSLESGIMKAHNHAEELLYILAAKNSWLRYGATKDDLSDPVPFERGTMIHFPDLEWHVFEFGEDGYVDLIFFYGQVDNIRPEDRD
jgi:hypothetical protein